MVMKLAGRKSLCKIASSVLGPKTPKFLSLVEHWLEHKGPEWLSERWKNIRNSAIKARSGDLEGAVNVMVEGGISVKRNVPESKGIFGDIQHIYLNVQDPHKLRSVEALLRGYTGISLKNATKKQVAKARKDITEPPSANSDILQVSCSFASKSNFWKDLPYLHCQDEPNTVSISGIRTYYSGYIGLPTELKKVPFASAIVSALTVGSVPKSVISLCGDNDIRALAEDVQKEIGNNPNTFGKLSFLQEGGCKARTVCLPSFWMQAYYQPLQRKLLHRIEYLERNQKVSLGVSCVLDQNKGAYVFQEWMRNKTKVYSFDLSAATDRFPLEPQLSFLESKGLAKWTEPVREAARGLYYNPNRKENWTYSVGQPMGLCFSFPLFHLTHHAILDMLSLAVKPKTNPAFAVLGDDVIISDKALAHSYRNLIEGLGVEVSKSKSLESYDVQTFAGFTGVTTSRGIQIFRPFKHGLDFSIQGRDLSLIATLGPEMRKWGKWWSKSFDELRRTFPMRQPDLTPILTESDDQLKSRGPSSRWYSAVSNRVLRTWLKWKSPDMEDGDLHLAGVTGTADWDRLWSSLLREKESVLTRVFDPKQYVTEERSKARTYSQISKDPLIRDIRTLDKARQDARTREGVVKKVNRLER